MKIEEINLNDLKEYGRNARTHSAEQIEQIAESIKSFGYDDFRFLMTNDCYACTRDGTFFRVCRQQLSKAGNVIRKYKTVKLNGSIDKYGYMTYRIMTKHGKKHLKAHREIMLAWCGKSNLPTVNHKDGNKRNNSLENLEWCSYADNIKHAFRIGLNDPKKCVRKSAVPLFDYVAIYGLWKYAGYSLSRLAEMNRCSRGAIQTACKRVEIILNMIKGNNNAQKSFV